MEIPLPDDLESKLARLATRHGRETGSLVVEAVERMVHHEEWFLQQLDEGVAAAEQGKCIEHIEVLKLIERRYPD
jgi:predicted transcriptional regulator